MKNLVALVALSLTAAAGCAPDRAGCTGPTCPTGPVIATPDLSLPADDMARPQPPPPPDMGPPPDPFGGIPSGFAISQPSSYDFGSVPVGNVASTTFTITITGTYPNYIQRWSIVDESLQPSDQFAISVSGCSGYVQIGDRCTATVSFSPVRGGSARALLEVVPTDGTSVTQIFAVARLSGAASATHTTLTADTASFDFGGRQLASMNNLATFSFHNSGAAQTTALGVTIDGDGFTIENDQCSNQHLPAGAGCNVMVRFSPTALKSYAGQLHVATANIAAMATVSLAGHGIDPARLQLTQPTFAAQWLGATSPAATAHVSNSGSDASGALHVTLAGSDAAAFAVASDGCSGQALPGGGGCDLGVTFTPTQRRAYAATLTVDGGSGQTVTVSLSGNGLTHSVLVTSGLQFGTSDGGTGNMVFQNRGDDATQALATALAPGGGPFSLDSDGCAGQILSPSGTCTVRVRFAPSVAGSYDGSVTVTGAAAGPAVGTLHGALAATPQLRVSPSSLEFGSYVYPSADLTVALWNVGPGALALTTSIADPVFQAGVASLSLAAGQHATLHVTFTPPASAEYASTLLLKAADGSTVASVALHGIGLWPAFDFSPSPLDFGTVVRGKASAPATVTVHNQSNRAQGTRYVVIGDDYTVDSTTCADTLAPGAACTVTLTFGPRTGGPSSGQLVFPDAEAQPTLALTGTGQ